MTANDPYKEVFIDEESLGKFSGRKDGHVKSISID